uniref:Exocyst complex component 3 like 2 n=1 Tax=Urocitellus parryii TaxID=9999 RepID=A0A8D2KP50_UROPR
MQDEPYQALVAELHRRALVEYVRPLLRGRLHCRSARTRSRMAGRLREDAAQCRGCSGGWSPRPRGWTPWCRTWLKSCSWKTRPASRWRWGCWCATTQTSGGSTWRPSSTCADCTTLRRARRSWPWPGTWNSVRGEPCRPLGIGPSSRTSPCPALLSASASPSPWAASPCPGWPGPAWPVCPCGLGLCPCPGPGPSAEALPALGLSAPHFAAETPCPCATARDSLPGPQSPGVGRACEVLSASPKLPPTGSR